jgi:hypothetical protein
MGDNTARSRFGQERSKASLANDSIFANLTQTPTLVFSVSLFVLCGLPV